MKEAAKEEKKQKFLTHYNHQDDREVTHDEDKTEQCDTSIGSIVKRITRPHTSTGGFAVTPKMSDEEALQTEDRTLSPDYDALDAHADNLAIQERREVIERKKRKQEEEDKKAFEEDRIKRRKEKEAKNEERVNASDEKKPPQDADKPAQPKK